MTVSIIVQVEDLCSEAQAWMVGNRARLDTMSQVVGDRNQMIVFQKEIAPLRLYAQRLNAMGREYAREMLRKDPDFRVAESILRTTLDSLNACYHTLHGTMLSIQRAKYAPKA